MPRATAASQARRASSLPAGNLLLHSPDQGLQPHCSQITVAVMADGDLAGVGLLVAQDKHVGGLRQLGVADLLAHRLGAIVDPSTQAGVAQTVEDLAGSIVVPVSD